MSIPLFWYAVIFLFGLCFGSFFNVGIHRWPKEDKREREWVKTPSHCPKCGARIRWYHNIPLLGWLVLKGKCYDCKAPISIRYPLVELGTALLWVGTVWLTANHGLTGLAASEMTLWHIALAVVFMSFYFLTVIIDFETQIIPNEVNYPYIVLAWVFVFACFPHNFSAGWGGHVSTSLTEAWQAGFGVFFQEVLLSSLIGMVSVSLLFLVFCLLGWMGFGDVLFMIATGALFGWKLVLAQTFIGVLIGGIVAITLMVYLVARGKYKKKIPIAFGPFLAIGAAVTLFWGNELVAWYLGLFGL